MTARPTTIRIMHPNTNHFTTLDRPFIPTRFSAKGGLGRPAVTLALETSAHPDKKRPPGLRAVEFARAQLGKPYRWGGEGPNSFDCSGLSMRAWQAAGVSIPRTSQGQWAMLSRVSLNRLQTGDLIIYLGGGHVGIYVGQHRIIHAPRPGRRVSFAELNTMPIVGAVRP
ncbi:NlpC/P60 family protein [Streptomyces olivoreticuli]